GATRTRGADGLRRKALGEGALVMPAPRTSAGGFGVCKAQAARGDLTLGRAGVARGHASGTGVVTRLLGVAAADGLLAFAEGGRCGATGGEPQSERAGRSQASGELDHRGCSRVHGILVF